MKRHAAVITVTTRVKRNPDSLKEFARWISCMMFNSKLKVALKQPEAQASKKLLTLITSPCIALFQNKISLNAG